MLSNQVASLIRAVLPVVTVVAFLVAHGFTPDEAQIVVDSSISLAVTLAMVGWGWWSHRSAAVIKDVVALPLSNLSPDEVAKLVDKIATLEKVKEVVASPDLAKATESKKVVSQ